MKKVILSAAALIFACGICFSAKPQSIFWQEAQAMTDTAKSAAVLEQGIKDCELRINSGNAGPADFDDCVQAVNVLYFYIEKGTEEDRKNAYSKVISMFEKYPENMKSSAAYNAGLALMWARIGDITGGLSTAEKIKKYSEESLKADPSYDKGEVNIIIGRLHYKAPNVPFVLSWPDKKTSKTYLEEALKADPGSLISKFFLADTLWELNEKNAALKLYSEVKAAEPRKAYYLKDAKVKRMCEKRMKELGI